MSDTRARLVRCFQAVFPNLSDAEAAGGSAQNIAAWDSVAVVNLVAVAEEEFDCEFPLDDIEHLTSFQAFLTRLEALTKS